MKLNSFYPVLMTKDVEKSKEFYEKHFNFSTTFEAEWYVSMINKESGYEIAFLDATHKTIPEKFSKPVQGLLLNMEVDDVDAVYQNLIVEKQLPIHLDLRNEPFGQRHFITSDPDNVLIDVIKVIPPDEIYSQQYREDN